MCQKAHTYPYQTYCCCSGDGCNGDNLQEADTATVNNSNPISCYQGQQSAALLVQGSAKACPPNAWSCLKTTNPVANTVTYAIQSNNCSVCNSSSFIGSAYALV